jgi:cysteine desulfuration protein SufE
MSNTQTERADELVEAFEMFDNWEDRYRFLIDLGKKLPPLPENAKTEENLVQGCQSNVWMIAEPKREADETRIDFIADSDSTIVRGLIAILRNVYSGETPRDILQFDIDALLRRIELDQHLSLGRRNGLAGMVNRVKTLAAQEST